MILDVGKLNRSLFRVDRFAVANNASIQIDPTGHCNIDAFDISINNFDWNSRSVEAGIAKWFCSWQGLQQDEFARLDVTHQNARYQFVFACPHAVDLESIAHYSH